MTAQANRKFQEQLPRFNRWTAERLFSFLGALCSIAAIGLFFVGEISADLKMVLALSYLLIIVVLLLLRIAITDTRKLHRYSDAAVHLHYVVHRTRNHLARLRVDASADLGEALLDIVNSAATAFSLVVGKQCRVCIKEVHSDETVTTVVRDSLFSEENSAPNRIVHTLEKNTDFINVWYGKDGCRRYFLENDLQRLWKAHKYKNSSFEEVGEPALLPFGKVSWKLPYKSTAVFPIRYIHDARNWPPTQSSVRAPATTSDPHVWGFLCVDCAHSGVFKLPYIVELGGAFADALYIMLTHDRFARQGAPLAEALSSDIRREN